MTSPSSEAVLCIGSNCGDRETNVAIALKWLSEILTDFRHSNIYATPDCHGGQRVYMNAVCMGLTELSADCLNMMSKEFELSQGRNEAARAIGDVPVDIDVVVFDGEILRLRDYSAEFFMKGFRELAL